MIAGLFTTFCFSYFFFSILISAADFFILFLGFEGFSLTVAILLVLQRGVESVITAVKYFSLNLFATICFILSTVLLYTEVGSTRYADIKIYLNTLVLSGEVITSTLQLAVVFLIIGFLFKLACFPFGMWSVDVYAGTTYNLIFLLTILAKFVILVSLSRIVLLVFPQLSFI